MHPAKGYVARCNTTKEPSADSTVIYSNPLIKAQLTFTMVMVTACEAALKCQHH